MMAAEQVPNFLFAAVFLLHHYYLPLSWNGYYALAKYLMKFYMFNILTKSERITFRRPVHSILNFLLNELVTSTVIVPFLLAK